jgi:dTDP-4-amino-4,6-dideoxygalactose transaminase
MDAIVPWAQARGLAVVEDAAHAPGARLAGRPMGTWGDLGCFSFFSNKNMTTGEGGMVTTDHDDLAARLRRLRSHGMTTLTLDRHKGHAFDYDVVDLGYNYRMSELNAALGLCQLERLAQANARRVELWTAYRARLGRIDAVKVPFAHARGEATPHIMPVLLPRGVERSRVMQGMKDAGIQTSIHYRAVDTFTAFRDAGLGPAPNVPRAHDVAERELTLPLYPSMTDADIELVCATLEGILGAAHAQAAD